MSSRKAFIAEQIQYLKSEIDLTAGIVESLHRNGGVVPWATEARQKTSLQVLEEQLQDERLLLTDLERLQWARLRGSYN